MKVTQERLKTYRNREDLEGTSTNEEEMRDVRVLLKKEMIFTIPLPSKDPLEVEVVEDKLKYKVDRLHTLTHGSKLLSSYHNRDKR